MFGGEEMVTGQLVVVVLMMPHWESLHAAKMHQGAV